MSTPVGSYQILVFAPDAVRWQTLSRPQADAIVQNGIREYGSMKQKIDKTYQKAIRFLLIDAVETAARNDREEIELIEYVAALDQICHHHLIEFRKKVKSERLYNFSSFKKTILETIQRHDYCVDLAPKKSSQWIDLGLQNRTSDIYFCCERDRTLFMLSVKKALKSTTHLRHKILWKIYNRCPDLELLKNAYGFLGSLIAYFVSVEGFTRPNKETASVSTEPTH